MSNVSAFSALRPQEPEEEDDIKYEIDSEDIDEESDDGITPPVISNLPSNAPSSFNSNVNLNSVLTENLNKYLVSVSNVLDNNIVIKEDSTDVVLNEGEYLLIYGQFELSVKNGSISYNNQILNEGAYTLVHPLIHSIPIIFNNESTSVQLTLKNSYNGLENIGNIYPPLKNIFKEKELRDYREREPVEEEKYSYNIILRPMNNVFGVHIDPIWTSYMKTLIENYKYDNVPVILIIGNKNTGKSTFSKILLNSFVSNLTNTPISYLDLDPGQPEFSHPESISLSLHSSFTFTNSPCDYIKNHYVGFNSSINQPKRYLRLVEDLFNHYNDNFKSNLSPLIINFPGWIKGYGLELLIKLTALIHPTNIINLSDRFEYKDSLTFDEYVYLPGLYITSKYLSNQLRTFKKLSYFHPNNDFKTHLLSKSPYQISYTDKYDSSFKGVCGTLVLNNSIINPNHCSLVLDASIVALYGISNSDYSSLKVKCSPNQPLLIEESSYDELPVSRSKFYGLAIIHSINSNNKVINLYTPIDVKSVIDDLAEYKLILIKGVSETPINELIPNWLVDKYYNKDKTKKNGKFIPYVSFEKRNKVESNGNMRRNVMRRGQ